MTLAAIWQDTMKHVLQGERYLRPLFSREPLTKGSEAGRGWRQCLKLMAFDVRDVFDTAILWFYPHDPRRITRRGGDWCYDDDSACALHPWAGKHKHVVSVSLLTLHAVTKRGEPDVPLLRRIVAAHSGADRCGFWIGEAMHSRQDVRSLRGFVPELADGDCQPFRGLGAWMLCQEQAE